MFARNFIFGYCLYDQRIYLDLSFHVAEQVSFYRSSKYSGDRRQHLTERVAVFFAVVFSVSRPGRYIFSARSEFAQWFVFVFKSVRFHISPSL